MFSNHFGSVKDAEVTFLAVGTPSSDDGSADLTYLYNALDSVLENITEGTIVAIKSTVAIGTGNDVRDYIRKNSKKDISVINNPEFLRER